MKTKLLFLALALLGTQVEAKKYRGHGHNVGFNFSFGNPFFGFTVGRPAYRPMPVVYQPVPVIPVYSPFGFFGF